ncbi:MAG: folate-binding protein [Cyanobacteria bacterium P01_H01_bin.130]
MAESLSPLQQLQQAQGAVLDPAIAPVPAHYNAQSNQDGAIAAALEQGTVVVDRSHWTRLQFTGADRLDFLHNQTTQNFKTRQPGQGCFTTIVTATARLIDLALAIMTEESVALLASPEMGDRLMTWFDRYIFPMDRVTVTDCSDETVTFTLLGPQAQTVLETLGFTALDTLAPCAHQTVTVDGAAVQAIAHSGLGRSGYTLWTDRDQGAALWERLTALGAVPAGEQHWETWRIEDGVPKPGSELTDDYNPLEAGLWQAVSIDKGCYIGQETIARLNTYDGVKQRLYGLQLTEPMEPGTRLSTMEGDKAGVLTSCRTTPDGVLGLAYIRRKVCAIGTTVKPTDPTLGDGTGTVQDVPFPVRANPDG